MATVAGIVLAGGRSSRMGTSKAALEWHGSTLLRRIAGIVDRTVGGPVVVVRAPGQALPALPAGIGVVEDPVEGRGPLQGLAAGLAAVREHADIAYATSTDVPFLHPAFIRAVLAALGDDVDIVLPHLDGHPQPLAAAYRVELVDVVDRLIAQGRMRPAFLFEASRVRRLDASSLLADPVLAALDPDLDSVLNVNEPGDYEAARARPAPDVTVGRGAVVAAATLGEAAAGVGLSFAAGSVNGGPITRDAETPLVAGDAVTF